jgi:hypothetical protein
MSGGRERAPRRIRAGRSLLLVSVAASVLGLCVFLLPALIVPIRTDPVGSIAALDRAKLQNERIGLQNQVRTTLLQAFGGAFLLVTAYITWRQVQVNREGQITERFTRAIEHLGAAEHLDVRLGGIYALERIAHDSHNERSFGDMLHRPVQMAGWHSFHRFASELRTCKR